MGLLLHCTCLIMQPSGYNQTRGNAQNKLSSTIYFADPAFDNAGKDGEMRPTT
jgi:hypothetical protein